MARHSDAYTTPADPPITIGALYKIEASAIRSWYESCSPRSLTVYVVRLTGGEYQYVTSAVFAESDKYLLAVSRANAIGDTAGNTVFLVGEDLVILSTSAAGLLKPCQK